MSKLKNVICTRCAAISYEAEVLKDEFGKYWYCGSCGARKRITTTDRPPLQRTTWLASGQGRWAKFSQDTGEVIEISKDEEQFPGIVVYHEPKRHGIIGMQG